jgi:hypothetical protein
MVQKGSGWKFSISSWRITQNPSVGVWHGPYDTQLASRLLYLPWKYLLGNKMHENGVDEKPSERES